MSERPVLLEVDNLQAGFGSQPVLHGVSFRVYEGEVAAVLGLNGAGKSVTLKTIGGVLPAWAGRVRFLGVDVTRMNPERRDDSQWTRQEPRLCAVQSARAWPP
ncbi:MAG: ATP-binding cassette domain-containing protein, partial [Chloroflexi bacterium]|nr:ATP-binding cassette domain-containing protein [Chloroflexota bacterium]